MYCRAAEDSLVNVSLLVTFVFSHPLLSHSFCPLINSPRRSVWLLFWALPPHPTLFTPGTSLCRPRVGVPLKLHPVELGSQLKWFHPTTAVGEGSFIFCRDYSLCFPPWWRNGGLDLPCTGHIFLFLFLFFRPLPGISFIFLYFIFWWRGKKIRKWSKRKSWPFVLKQEFGWKGGNDPWRTCFCWGRA